MGVGKENNLEEISQPLDQVWFAGDWVQWENAPAYGTIECAAASGVRVAEQICSINKIKSA